MADLNTAFSRYELPLRWDKKFDVGDLTRLKIFVNEKDSFQANNLNIFTNYVLSFFNDSSIQKWLSSCDMSFYQNQLNFAVWCASSGCGVSVSEYLQPKENLISSVFRFHIYYQTRKLLEEMSCSIPGESIFKEMDNRIDMLKFQKLCNEFDVKNKDFRFKGGDNGGLGTMYNYFSRMGYRPLKGIVYNSNRFQFISNSTNGVYKIDYVKQDVAIEGWKQFLLEKSNGFTKAGVVRLDDSIRTYAYCILGSQAQTRSNILASVETQQNFVDLLEKNIKSMFSIPESIAQYQNSLTNTNSKIDYVIGAGLYMIPSDLGLKPGSLQRYNNNILIADKSLKLGYNEALNMEQKLVSVPLKPDLQSVKPPPVDKVMQKEESNVDIENIYLYFGISALVFAFCYVFLKK
jgi:hypothetical protein